MRNWKPLPDMFVVALGAAQQYSGVVPGETYVIDQVMDENTIEVRVPGTDYTVPAPIDWFTPRCESFRIGTVGKGEKNHYLVGYTPTPFNGSERSICGTGVITTRHMGKNRSRLIEMAQWKASVTCKKCLDKIDARIFDVMAIYGNHERGEFIVTIAGELYGNSKGGHWRYYGTWTESSFVVNDFQLVPVTSEWAMFVHAEYLMYLTS